MQCEVREALENWTTKCSLHPLEKNKQRPSTHFFFSRNKQLQRQGPKTSYIQCLKHCSGKLIVKITTFFKKKNGFTGKLTFAFVNKKNHFLPHPSTQMQIDGSRPVSQHFSFPHRNGWRGIFPVSPILPLINAYLTTASYSLCEAVKFTLLTTAFYINISGFFPSAISLILCQILFLPIIVSVFPEA